MPTLPYLSDIPGDLLLYLAGGNRSGNPDCDSCTVREEETAGVRALKEIAVLLKEWVCYCCLLIMAD